MHRQIREKLEALEQGLEGVNPEAFAGRLDHCPFDIAARWSLDIHRRAVTLSSALLTFSARASSDDINLSLGIEIRVTFGDNISDVEHRPDALAVLAVSLEGAPPGAEDGWPREWEAVKDEGVPSGGHRLGDTATIAPRAWTRPVAIAIPSMVAGLRTLLRGRLLRCSTNELFVDLMPMGSKGGTDFAI